MKNNTIRVLVIEDNPGDARLIRENLIEAKDTSFRLEFAATLSKGLKHLAEEDIDVALLDLSLPDSQGFDTFQRTYDKNPGMPIIVLTGLDDETVAVKAVHYGAQDYLVKGEVNSHLLARSIRYAIERKKAERQILESEERYRSLVESTEDSIYVVDKNYSYLFMNKIHQSRMGIPDGQYTGRSYSEFHSQHETKCFIEQVNRVLETGETVNNDYESLKNNRHFLQTYSPVKDKDGRTVTVTVVSKDMTRYKRMEEDLRTQSITDELTGLYNRRGFFTLGQQQLKIAKRQLNGIILFSADMDGLKTINDTLGHKAGDAAIIGSADILRESFRETDIVSRIGGDEFVALQMVNTDIPSEIITDRVQKKLEIYNAKQSAGFKLSISVGIKYYGPNFNFTLDEMLAQADKLMYEQKRKKKELCGAIRS